MIKKIVKKKVELEELFQNCVVLFVILMICAVSFLAFLYWIGWFITNRKGSKGLYDSKYLYKGTKLTFAEMEAVYRYLNLIENIDNPTFDLNKAAICKNTGKIFPDCINIFNIVCFKKDFLAKRYSGHWVAWSFLTKEQKENMLMRYSHLYEYSKELLNEPDRIYVDPESKILMEWESVPKTNLKVLVVKR